MSVLCSEVFTKSAKGIYDLIRAVLLFFAAATIVANTKNLPSSDIVKYLLVLMTALILISYVLLAGMEGMLNLRNNPQVTRCFSGIHEYANVVSITILGLIAIWVAGKSSFSLLYCICILILSFVLVMSDSRGAYLALLLCLLYLPCYYDYRLKRAWFVIALLVVAAFIYLSFYHVGASLFGYDIPASFLERFELSVGTTEAIAKAPWLGYGLNTYKYIGEQIGWDAGYIMPHNIFLELVFSIGIPCSILLAANFFKLVNVKNRGKLTATDDFWLMLAHLLLIYLSFRGLTELRLGYKTWGMLMVSLGIMSGISLKINKTQSAIDEK